MKRIAVLAGLFAAFFAASAADFVVIDLNFYSETGTIAVEGKLPEGVTMPKKVRFINPKLKGYAFRLNVDLSKTRSVDVKFKVKGAGKIDPSVSCMSIPKRAGMEVECLEFEFCGEASDKTPLVFKKWTSMGGQPPFVAEDGEALTLKAKFKLVK